MGNARANRHLQVISLFFQSIPSICPTPPIEHAVSFVSLKHKLWNITFHENHLVTENFPKTVRLFTTYLTISLHHFTGRKTSALTANFPLRVTSNWPTRTAQA